MAIVNQTFARKLWGGELRAIGQHFILSGTLIEVVGVAEDGKYHDLQESPQSAAYLPLSQTESGETIFVVRSQRTPSQMSTALAQTLSGLAPNIQSPSEAGLTICQVSYFRLGPQPCHSAAWACWRQCWP